MHGKNDGRKVAWSVRTAYLPITRVLQWSRRSNHDGQAWIVRLFNPTDHAARVRLIWSDPIPRTLQHSNAFEEPQGTVDEEPVIPAPAVMTFRAETHQTQPK